MLTLNPTIIMGAEHWAKTAPFADVAKLHERAERVHDRVAGDISDDRCETVADLVGALDRQLAGRQCEYCAHSLNYADSLEGTVTIGTARICVGCAS